MTPEYTAPAIRKVLEDAGFGVFSVRKNKRMIGGQRYNFHGGLRQGYCKGSPQYFYLVELSSTGFAEDDYQLAALLLQDAGYSEARFDRQYYRTRIDL